MQISLHRLARISQPIYEPVVRSEVVHKVASVFSRLILNQDCINVRGPVRAHLSGSDRAVYELYILPWKSEDCPTHRIVYEAGHLLLSHDEDRVGAGGAEGSQ